MRLIRLRFPLRIPLSAPPIRRYDARARTALRRAALLLRVPWAVVANMEAAVGAETLQMRLSKPVHAGSIAEEGSLPLGDEALARFREAWSRRSLSAALGGTVLGASLFAITAGIAAPAIVSGCEFFSCVRLRSIHPPCVASHTTSGAQPRKRSGSINSQTMHGVFHRHHRRRALIAAGSTSAAAAAASASPVVTGLTAGAIGSAGGLATGRRVFRRMAGVEDFAFVPVGAHKHAVNDKTVPDRHAMAALRVFPAAQSS